MRICALHQGQDWDLIREAWDDAMFVVPLPDDEATEGEDEEEEAGDDNK